MSAQKTKNTTWTLASLAIDDAYTDFYTSRKAMQCSQKTLEFYYNTAGRFVDWLKEHNTNSPAELTSRQVREYIAGLSVHHYTDWTLNGHARGIKTLVRFWYEEKYIPEEIKFAMPKVANKRLPVLSANQVITLLTYCENRDKAIILLMVDTGLRRAEVCDLNWGDVDINSGVIRIRNGKGGKSRTVVIGAQSRRAILAYHRELKPTDGKEPLFQSRFNIRFTGEGLRTLFSRLSKRSKIQFSAHALRRTFAILSLRSGMDVLHLQALLGHASLEMVQHYVQMVDDDLIQSHRDHSPVDNLKKLK